MQSIQKKLQNFHGIEIDIEENKKGPSEGKPIQIEVNSFNAESIRELQKIISSVPGIKNVNNDLPNAEIEWNIEINKEKAALYGADITLIGQYVNLATSGVQLSKYMPNSSEEEVKIVARLPEEKRNITDLKDMFINTKKGSVAISSFIEITPKNKAKQINRVNGARVNTISADVEKGILVTEKIKEIKDKIKNHSFEDVQIKFKGQDEDQKEAGSFLSRAFLFALLFMVLILLLQFNSFYQVFIIMSAILLSTAGVLLGLLITKQAFGIVMCGVGVIALAGIVVNNNILLIDAYNEYKSKGYKQKEAILVAAVSRLRPILLTAGTTVLGLIPVILAINIDFIGRDITYDAPSNQWWRQLSTAIAGGLSFATILTLFFTPALLLLKKDSSK